MNSPSATWVYTGKVTAAWLLAAPALLAFSVVLIPPMHDVVASTDSQAVDEVGLGPFGAGLLSMAMLCCSALAMLIHVAAGGRVRWLSSLLVAVGAAVALWHLSWSSEDGFIGSMWIGGAALGLAAFHLGEDATIRRWVTSALAAMIGVWLIQGLWYVNVEHPMTVSEFQANVVEVLSNQGIEPGTSADMLYRRRMMDSSLIGSVGFSNVMGGIVAAVTVLVFGGVATALSDSGLKLRKGSRRLSGIGLGMVMAGLYVVWLTQSRGAMAAALGVGVWVVMAAVWDQRRRSGGESTSSGRGITAVALGLVVCAMLAIAIRGGLIGPPESVQGERSLMFRWWYWVGAWHIAFDTGWRWLGGVGVFGFSDAFARLKPEMLPEDVTSTHNLWVDWLVMLGVGGLAWAAVTAIWLVRGLRGWCVTVSYPMAMPVPWGLKVRCYVVTGLALSLFATQFMIEQATMYSSTVVLWFVGVAWFVATVTWLTGLRRGSICDRGIMLGVVASGLFVMIHGQLEMTFFQPGSVAMVWLLIGLCGSMANQPDASIRPVGMPRRIDTAVTVGMLVMMIMVGLVWVRDARSARVTRTQASELRERVWGVQPMVADLADLERLLELRPHALLDHARAGWLYEVRGDSANAAKSYRRALEISEAMYLDPARMLDDQHRQSIERRLRLLESSVAPKP